MSKKPTRYYSKKQEDAIARELGGKRVSNSGATPFHKGDVILDNILVEAKTVTKPQQSVSIKKEWLTKNQEEAFAMRKDMSVLAFDFGTPDRYYIVGEQDFKQLLSAYNTLIRDMEDA